jgi:hypothetical protein
VKAARAVATVWLVLFALFQVGGLVTTVEGANNPIARVTGNIYWPIRWKMFTGLSRTHTVMEFEGWNGAAWELLPMEEWYPAQWESGYRWERTPVYTYRSLQVPFLAAACEHTDDSRVRLVQRSWNKTLGQREQPRKKVREKVLRVWECDREAPAPRGKVI